MNKGQLKEKTKEFLKKINKRTWISCAAVLIIGIAVLLNVLFMPATTSDAQGAVTPKIDLTNVSAILDDASNAANDAVDAFVEMSLSRQQARDEAIDVLTTLANSTSASEDEKNDAIAGIEVIANTIEFEANIESLLKSKGFEQCVAVISDNSASVIVKTEDTLAPNQIAQISEIVYQQSGIRCG